MLLEFCLAVGLAIIISALSSITEAALYSITNSHIEVLAKSGHRSGTILKDLKSDINKPITAILTVNTIANTMGAAIAGAAAAVLFGEHYLGVFSLALTFAILIFSEIIPKIIGVSYCKELAPWFAYPLYFLVKILYPLTWLTNHLAKLIEKPGQQSYVSAKEIQTIATMSKKSGEISRQEEKIIVNILELKHKTVRKAMTPRTVIFSLSAHLSVSEAATYPDWSFHSRVPVYDKDQGDIVGVVLSKNVLLAVAEGSNNSLPEKAAKDTLKLSDLMEPPHFVPESIPLPNVLLEFIEHRKHLFIVVDEYGGITGIISMEDIIEEIMGEEIMDESDKTQDMRALARFRKMTNHP
ncbi:MAG: hemolysin family protein [Desulfobulbaceae bacterium]|nr:hemolysin family protein [Desulfobulbaceae bacterium]